MLKNVPHSESNFVEMISINNISGGGGSSKVGLPAATRVSKTIGWISRAAEEKKKQRGEINEGKVEFKNEKIRKSVLFVDDLQENEKMI